MKKVTKAIAASPPDTFTLPCFGQPEFKQQCIFLIDAGLLSLLHQKSVQASNPVHLLGRHLRSPALIGAAGCQ